MKNLKKHLNSTIFVVLAFITFSCEPDDVWLWLKAKEHHLSQSNTFYSPAVPVGGGVVRTLVEINHAGEPLAVGLRISEKALTKLPDEMTQYVLQFHSKAAGVVPFEHVLLDWNPEGHEPPEIYGLPHFDFHFYTISVEERMQIGFDDPKAEVLPSSEFLPADYFPTPGYVPMMGKHWLDKFSPELHDQTFSHTFIYGSYDGEVVFYEPMITQAYLQTHPNEQFAIKQPVAFQQEGMYYPTKYSIQYDPVKKEYLILLEGLVQR